MTQKTLTVYVGAKSKENIEHALEHGVWGFKDEVDEVKGLAPGDFIVFGEGFSGSPRTDSAKWMQGSLETLTFGRITRALQTETTLEWPSEQRAKAVEYHHRVRFVADAPSIGPVELADAAVLTPALAEGLRRSASANRGVVIDDVPPGKTAAPLTPATAPLIAPPVAQPAVTAPPVIHDVPATLAQIERAMASAGMVLGSHVVHAFYASLRAKPFVLLAGNSGTGKSRLVRLFAEVCGATVENGRFQMIPVRPDWNDGSELVGYFDLNGDYQPGKIVPVLLRAHRAPTRPFFVCLDEMNLARVEHYFSDFLSVVESRRLVDGRVLSDPIVGTQELGAMSDKSLDAEERAALAKLQSAGRGLTFPDNVFVVGTVNMDETTQPFSRKVLDRANTLEFNDVDLARRPLSDHGSTAALDLDANFFRPDLVGMTALIERAAPLFDDVSSRLTALNRVLSEGGFEVGYRVRDEATAFVVFCELAGLSRDEALERVVLQKVLPRLQGSSPRIERVLRALIKEHTGEAVESNGAAAIEALQKLRLDGKTTALGRKLSGMLLTLWEEGFTSFWLG
jgi:hypothetical protein